MNFSVFLLLVVPLTVFAQFSDDPIDYSTQNSIDTEPPVVPNTPEMQPVPVAVQPAPRLADEYPDTEKLFSIPNNMWRCGTTPVVNKMVINGINSTCPLAAVDFNHCCAVHDDCYDGQFGQKHCDRQLCDCLNYFVATDPNAAKCSNLTTFACSLLTTFGADAYTASRKDENSTDTEEPVSVESLKVPTEIPQLSEPYVGIYSSCGSQHATFASCALKNDLCYRTSHVQPKEQCTLELIRCLTDTRYNRKPNRECDMTIDEYLWKLIRFSGASEEKEMTLQPNGTRSVEELNILMMQEILMNKTLVQKVYLQIVRHSTSLGWLSCFTFLFCVFSCCGILIYALSRCGEEEEIRRHQPREEVINVHVTSSASKLGTSSISEAPLTLSSIKSSSMKSSSSTRK